MTPKLEQVAADLRASDEFYTACEDAAHGSNTARDESIALVRAVVRAIGSSEAFEALRAEIG